MTRPAAHLANLDLNLLVALRELVAERSVTRAAETSFNNCCERAECFPVWNERNNSIRPSAAVEITSGSASKRGTPRSV